MIPIQVLQILYPIIYFLQLHIYFIKCKFQSQGELSTISDLRLSTTNVVLHVRVSRMWEFRGGGNEIGNIKHLDLVFIDLKVFS